MSKQLYILEFYVPEENLEEVLEAVFLAGAGRYKNYDRCAWTSKGIGRFRPLEKSDPFLGEQNKDTYVEEIKVECMVKEEVLQDVRDALLKAHPYEEPAYQIIVNKII